MKKISTMLFLLGLLIFGSISSYGAVFTFTPNPADIYGLDHYYAYTWGIEFDAAAYPVTSASLTFKNIRNWTADPNDILYMSLLDDAAVGVSTIYESNTAGDYFSDKGGILIDTWTDPDDPITSTNLTITLSEARIADLNNFAADGLFAFAFDPDCHYWNDGVELTLNADIPEPSTILLFGLGVLGLAAYRRKR